MRESLGLVQRAQPLEQWRVRVVPRRVEPVVHGEAQVVLVQLDQRLAQLRGSTHLHGEGVRLELEAATQAGQHEPEHLEILRSVTTRELLNTAQKISKKGETP